MNEHDDEHEVENIVYGVILIGLILIAGYMVYFIGSAVYSISVAASQTDLAFRNDQAQLKALGFTVLTDNFTTTHDEIAANEPNEMAGTSEPYPQLPYYSDSAGNVCPPCANYDPNYEGWFTVYLPNFALVPCILPIDSNANSGCIHADYHAATTFQQFVDAARTLNITTVYWNPHLSLFEILQTDHHCWYPDSVNSVQLGNMICGTDNATVVLYQPS